MFLQGQSMCCAKCMCFLCVFEYFSNMYEFHVWFDEECFCRTNQKNTVSDKQIKLALEHRNGIERLRLKSIGADSSRSGSWNELLWLYAGPVAGKETVYELMSHCHMCSAGKSTTHINKYFNALTIVLHDELWSPRNSGGNPYIALLGLITYA